MVYRSRRYVNGDGRGYRVRVPDQPGPRDDLGALERALDAEASPPAGSAPQFGASPGRSGDLRDELRVEPLEDGRLRIARWIMRPNFGWELQEAPVMLPAARYAEALRNAVRGGLLGASA